MNSPLRFQEPITKVSPVVLGKPCTIEPKTRQRLGCMMVTATVTVSAGGAGVAPVIPAPSAGVAEIRTNINGNVQRRRTADQLFGAQGLNALNDSNNGGTVQYFLHVADATALAVSATDVVTGTTSDGVAVGSTPVAIGGAEDLVLQKKITTTYTNKALIAVFTLPLIFAEDFRKDTGMAEVMALTTGFANGAGVGPVVFELDIPAATGVAGTMTAVAIAASVEYDELVASAGTVVRLSKEKLFNKQYASAGDIEVADQLPQKEKLLRVSLLSPAADPISKVVVKQGNRTIKNVTFEENFNALRKSGFNTKAIPRNRFDIEFDVNDDPNSAPMLNPLQELSIVATLASGNAATKNIVILPTYYGAIE